MELQLSGQVTPTEEEEALTDWGREGASLSGMWWENIQGWGGTAYAKALRQECTWQVSGIVSSGAARFYFTLQDLLGATEKSFLSPQRSVMPA